MERHNITVIIRNAYGAHLHSLNLVYTQDMVHHQSFCRNVDRKKIECRVEHGYGFCFTLHRCV